MTCHSDFISIGILHPFEPGHGIYGKPVTSFSPGLARLGTRESTLGTLNLSLHHRHFIITAMIFLLMNMWVFYEAGGCMSPELLLSCFLQSGQRFHFSSDGIDWSGASSYRVTWLPQPQHRYVTGISGNEMSIYVIQKVLYEIIIASVSGMSIAF